MIVEDFELMLRLAQDYKFMWVDRTVYNQRRHNKNITLVELTNTQPQLEDVVRQTLVSWGSEFQPIFKRKYGVIYHVDLIPPEQPAHPSDDAPTVNRADMTESAANQKLYSIEVAKEVSKPAMAKRRTKKASGKKASVTRPALNPLKKTKRKKLRQSN